jgi:hypothetical protein
MRVTRFVPKAVLGAFAVASVVALDGSPALAVLTVNLNEAETNVGATGLRDRIRETDLDTYEHEHELERITPASEESEEDSREFAKQTTRVQARPNGLSVTSSGEAVLEAPREIGLGVAYFALGFRSDEPITVSFSAQIQVESPLSDRSSNAIVDFSCGCDEEDDEDEEPCTVEDVELEVEDSSDHPRSASVSRSGRATGGCSLFVFTSTSLGAEQTTASGKWTVSLSVSAVPPEPEEDSDDFRWVGPTQGAFGDQKSWDPEGPLEEGVPTFADGVRSDTARFQSLGAVRVDLAAAANPTSRAAAPLPGCSGAVTRRTGRLVVSRTRELEPFNGTWALDNLSLDERSLEVGDNGAVLLSDAALCARHAQIGTSGRRSFVVATGPAGALQSLGTLSLGVGGEGNLRVTDGGVASLEEVRIGDGSALGRLEVSDATAQTGSLAVGFLSRGELLVEKSGLLESEAAYLGFMTSFPANISRTPLSRAVISNASTPGAMPPATWSVETLGLRMGDVHVDSGGHLEVERDLDAGQGDECCGRLRVRGGTVDVGGSLLVGLFGIGSLDVEDGPVDVEGVLAVGAPGTDNRGDVDVAARRAPGSDHLVSNGLDVRNGSMFLRDGAHVHTIGTANVDPEGRVDFRAPDALWRINDALFVGSAESTLDQARIDFTVPGGRIEVGTLSGPSLIHVRSGGRVLGAGTLTADSIQIDGVYGAGLTLDGNVTMGASAVFTSAFPLPFGARSLAPPSPPAAGLGAILTSTFPLLFSAPQLAPPLPSADALRSFGMFPRAVEPPPPPSGPVTITGDAALDGTLELSFLNGSAPAQGSLIHVLDVAGTLTGSFSKVVARGVTNAAFEQGLQDGVLTLTSLTDAEPLPVVKLKAKTKLSEKKAKSGLKVTFSRAGDVSQPLLVHYDLRGSARNALDYAALPRAIEIPARKKSAKLLVRPFRDDAGEPTETIEIELLPGDGYALGLSSKLEIALEDEVKKSKRR